MTELKGIPIEPTEARDMMTDDAVALLHSKSDLALARALADAIAALDVALDAHKD